MSRLFGSKAADADGRDSQLPLLAELGAEVDVVAQRLGALSLPQLAGEVMTNAFKPEYEPGAYLTETAVVVDTFMPPHGEFTGPVYKAPAPSPSQYEVRDMVSEALQLLVNACLLMPQAHNSNGNWTHLGYGTTRLGRAALADGSVEARVAAVAPAR